MLLTLHFRQVPEKYLYKSPARGKRATSGMIRQAYMSLENVQLRADSFIMQAWRIIPELAPFACQPLRGLWGLSFRHFLEVPRENAR